MLFMYNFVQTFFCSSPTSSSLSVSSSSSSSVVLSSSLSLASLSSSSSFSSHVDSFAFPLRTSDKDCCRSGGRRSRLVRPFEKNLNLTIIGPTWTLKLQGSDHKSQDFWSDQGRRGRTGSAGPVLSWLSFEPLLFFGQIFPLGFLCGELIWCSEQHQQPVYERSPFRKETSKHWGALLVLTFGDLTMLNGM